MYTLRFHFVGGGFQQAKSLKTDKKDAFSLAKDLLEMDLFTVDDTIINTRNVVSIDVVKRLEEE